MSENASNTSFDARVMWIDTKSLWGGLRQRDYLLRDDVSFVLSIDEGVWPTVFDDQAWGFSPSDIYIGGPERPSFVGINHPLWDSLDELRTYLKDHETRVTKPYWLVAFVKPVEAGNEAIEDGWDFLGYDVADAMAISGLSNCTYSASEKETIMQYGWADNLNEYHLFSVLNVADEFRAYSDKRVPEHAPFAVVAIYRVPDNDNNA